MVIENQYFHNVLKYATQIRGAISGMIFDKSLRLAADENAGSARGVTGVGGLLNLMQSDASILENTALQLHTVWDGPLQVSKISTLFCQSRRFRNLLRILSFHLINVFYRFQFIRHFSLDIWDVLYFMGYLYCFLQYQQIYCYFEY
jgi:hypothetical protein